MADSLALSGLASGVDTASIVSQLMALDRQTTTRMTYRQAAVTAQRTGLTTVASKLAAARAEAARELTALRDGRGAVAGYAAAPSPRPAAGPTAPPDGSLRRRSASRPARALS